MNDGEEEENGMDEIDWTADSFADIVAKDKRYDARAYALLMDVVNYLSGEEGKHVPGEDVIDEFRDRALDQFGPLTYTVLTEWGLSSTEDIGEMMFNLVESKRIGRDENDSADAFASGYDFKEAFLDPYQT